MTTFANELANIATTIARSAGQIVRDGAAANRFTVSTKTSATDPVTEIDQASEAHIVAELRRRRPDDGLLGEEGTAQESKSGVEWIIDPIDGTANFIYSIPFYAVSIGATFEGRPIAGAVYNPVMDEMFSAAEGEGACLNERPISVNPNTDLALALVGTGFSYSSEQRALQGRVVSRLLPDIRDLRRMGSAALDICSVACGRLDAYFEVGVKPWDITGASIVLTEAGGSITGFDGGPPTGGALAACTPEIHRALQNRLTD